MNVLEITRGQSICPRETQKISAVNMLNCLASVPYLKMQRNTFPFLGYALNGQIRNVKLQPEEGEFSENI